MGESHKGPGRPAASPMAMLGLGFEIAVPVVLLLFVGYKLDGWLETRPWLSLVGMLLGMFVGFYNLVKRVRPSGPPNGNGSDE